jgi:hypothetical protein
VVREGRGGDTVSLLFLAEDGGRMEARLGYERRADCDCVHLG